MKEIDFIIKNFQASSFIKDIQKGEEQWCEEEVAKNYKDYNDICSKLSYLKFFKGELKNIPFEDKNKKQIINFFKKEKEINPQNIEKFFFKKGIYNLPNLDYIRDYGATGDYKFNELIKTYVFQGILFQKVKEFSLIYNGFISFKSSEALIENDQYSIICFYSKTDKKYHYDLTRPGISLYGGHFNTKLKKLIKPVVKLKAKVLQIKKLEKNEYVGYNQTYKASNKKTIGILGIGYADGISRKLSNKGKVFFKNKKFSIIGRVSMDSITVDITKYKKKNTRRNLYGTY